MSGDPGDFAATGVLLDHVPRQFLPELGHGHLVLGLVKRGDGGVVHEVLLRFLLRPPLAKGRLNEPWMDVMPLN